MTPDFDPTEQAVAEMLLATRPSPAPGFRGSLASDLAEHDPGYGHRPAYLWPRVLGLLLLGAIVVLISLAVGVGGI